MAFQGMILPDGHGMKVVFPYYGRVHEVHLPPCSWHEEDSCEAELALHAEATIVLQCLTSRAALELQHELYLHAPQVLQHVPFGAPEFTSPLRGSFGDLVQQLQACVNQCHKDQATDGEPSITGLLMAAAAQGHASVAQQLLLISPRAGSINWESAISSPAYEAASSEHGAAVLELVLQAMPDLVRLVVEFDSTFNGWTLMHSAAQAGNVAAIRLLLQLAPELAAARTEFEHTPLHEAAGSGSPEALRLLLQAAPQTAATVDDCQSLPMHWAADGGCVECLSALLDAGAPGLDVPNDFGQLPLHLAASNDQEAAVRLLLAAYPAAALIEDGQGRRPLQSAVRYQHGWHHLAPNAARALLPVSGLSAQQLLDLLAAGPAAAQPLVQPLYPDVAAHLPLSPEQWQRVPYPCTGLGRALPAVLSRSEAEAALLAAHLPPADSERLRVAALSLHRVQRTLCFFVPAALLGRILALSLSDA